MPNNGSLPHSSEKPLRRMYLLCNNCHAIISKEDVKRHIEKCKGATFNCCDCNEELQVAFIERHKECPNAIKTVAPPVYNPKSVLVHGKYNHFVEGNFEGSRYVPNIGPNGLRA